jgi:hypothetical protein
MEQQYRFNFKLRRRGDAALDNHFLELKSEDYDNDEEFCTALASEAMDMLTQDRDYLEQQEGASDE